MRTETSTAPARADAAEQHHVEPVRAARVAPEGDGHPAVALVALSTTALLAVAAIVLLAVNRPTWHVGQWFFLVDLADAIVYGVVGWVLLSRVSRPVVWIVVGCALGGGLAALSMQWTELRGDHPDLPPLSLLASAQSWAWIPGTLALMLVAPWLVRSGPLDVVGRVGVAVGLVVSWGHLLVRWTDPFPWPDGPSVMPLAIHDATWVDRIEVIDRTVMGIVTVLGLVAAADVARRWRRANPLARRGLGWLAVGGALMSATFAPLALPPSWTDALPLATTPLLHLTSQLFFPAALLVAVLGQQLWGLRIAVSRAIAWSLLTAALVTGYALLLGLVGLVLPGLADGVEQVAAAALLAAAVDPIRRFVQRRVDHLVHGDAREPLLAVDRVGARLGGAHDPTLLLSSVLEGIVDSLRLSGAAIDRVAPAATRAAVDDPSGTRVAVGAAGPDALELPLSFDGEPLGSLTVWPRPGERLDQRTRRALDALVPTVAVATQLASTAIELQASRSRVVIARDEERSTLRRELHDGLGPALAGVGYGIAAARTMLLDRPEAAGALLERLGDEVDRRVEEVRTLARELVPPVLVDAGLGPALLELAARQRLGGLDVRTDVDERVVLGPVVDSALYGIAAEAMRNVQRHAAATTCHLRLRRDAGGVEMIIADDGVGIGDDAVRGVGLQSMRERASALGAALEVSSSPGAGTVVRVMIDDRRRPAT